MAKPLKDYVIPFAGLKNGEHAFTFKVDKTFFQEFDFSEIEESELEIDMVLEKQETMLTLHFDIRGTIQVDCDRCVKPFEMEVAGENRQFIKFSEGGALPTEEVTVLQETAYEVNVAHFIYEFTHLLLPARRVHPEGECDEAVASELDRYLIYSSEELEDEEEETPDEEETIDSRWAALKGLNKNDLND